MTSFTCMCKSIDFVNNIRKYKVFVKGKFVSFTRIFMYADSAHIMEIANLGNLRQIFHTVNLNTFKQLGDFDSCLRNRIPPQRPSYTLWDLVDKNSFQGPIFYQTKLYATSCIRFKASGFSAGKDHHAMITDSRRSECYTYFTLRVCEQLMEISHGTQNSRNVSQANL